MSQPGSNARPDLPLAVIVGAGGMGMAVARRLGQDHRLLIADFDQEHLRMEVDRLTTDGYDASGIRVDVTRIEDIEALARAAEDAGPVKVLANVVGLSVAAGSFDAIISVNLIGAAAIAGAFQRFMASGGCGLFISSSAAHMRDVPDPLWPLLDNPLREGFLAGLRDALGEKANAPEAYSLSKAALNRMCQRRAAEWGRRGLRILSLSPGFIATPMGAEAYKHSQAKRDMFDAIPLQREGTMLEIANVVEFLVSDRASFLSGTDILVDGGMIGALRFPPDA
ncbi:MAG TPA: SDR family oxidoreductase [Sphingobium sp.]|uniref:SDR family oxidoreductase n=1 Tax=Sphingobium sp. TaxID=1912891 RepID=UPI002ED611B0